MRNLSTNGSSNEVMKVSKMSNKVLPSSKVSRPTGDLGSYPQRTAPNPSQMGMNKPKDPPRISDIGEPAPFDPDRNGGNR
jgi:hypothetical protein